MFRALLLAFATSLVAASFNVDEQYIAYLSSDMYIDSLKDQLLPENCYVILFEKFQGVLENTVFENALNHTGCDRAPLEGDHGPLINPDYVASVPIDDFILSRDILVVLASINERAYAIGAEWPGSHQQTNLLTFHLMTGLNQRSTCDTIDCRVFRKLVEQFHFRLTLLLARKIPAPNKFDFLLPIDVVFEARRYMESVVMSSLPRAPEPIVGRAEIVRAGCLGRLCRGVQRQPTSRTATPVIPLVDHYGVLSTKQTRKGIAAFGAYADNQLDSVMVQLGSVAAEPSFSIMITTVRNKIIRPLVEIARGVIFNGYDYERLFQILFHFIALVDRAREDGNPPFPELLVLTRECVSQLRLVTSQLSIV
jgi:hypothetical protein